MLPVDSIESSRNNELASALSRLKIGVARPRANAMGVMVGNSKHALRKLRDVPHRTQDLLPNGYLRTATEHAENVVSVHWRKANAAKPGVRWSATGRAMYAKVLS